VPMTRAHRAPARPPHSRGRVVELVPTPTLRLHPEALRPTGRATGLFYCPSRQVAAPLLAPAGERPCPGPPRGRLQPQLSCFNSAP